MNPPKPRPADAPPTGGDPTKGGVPHAETPRTGGGPPRLRLEPGGAPVPDYQLVAFLGRGGYGEVWRRGPGGHPVALKFIPMGEASGAAEERAAELLKSKDIRHPNLLGLFGSWRRSGTLILALELADRTLMDRLNEAHREGLPGVPFLELREYMSEAAKGLDHLNAIGVQHRDVKPQNLLLVGGGVKVADFGLAKVMERTTTTNTGSMTPAYAAPEFLQGRVSQHSDQYSLAVAYCQLRGGQLPFNGGPAQVMMGHLYETPDLSAVPPLEQPVVAKALAKDPNERFPSCREFVDALVAAVTATVQPLSSPPVRKRPPSALPPSQQTMSGRPPSSVRRRPASPDAAPPRSAVRTAPQPMEAPPQASGRPMLALALTGGLLLLLAVVAAAVTSPLWLNRKPAAADGPAVTQTTPPDPVKVPPKDPPKKPVDVPPPKPQPTQPPTPPTPPRPVLHLSPIAPVTLAQGKSTTVKVRVQRDDHARPIEFALEDLPAGVGARRVPGGGDADSAVFELTAAADAAPTDQQATATARVGETKTDGSFEVTVTATVAVQPDDGKKTAIRTAMRQGRDHLARCEWSQARASFGVAIELDPNNAEAYAYRANADDNAHRLDEALEDADKAVELDPTSALARAYRCEVYADKGDLDKALEDGDRAVDLDQNSAVARRSRGYAYVQKGDPASARTDFDEAIRLDSAYPDPYVDRGRLEFADGQEDDALRDYEKAISLAPHCAPAYVGRATVHIKQGNPDAALDDLNQAVQQAPKDADALVARGEFHHGRGDVDLALADLKAALRLAPKAPEAHLALADIYAGKRDADRAIEEYSEVIELNSRSVSAYNGRAWQRYAKRDYDAALGDFDEAIRLDGKNSNDFDGHGWCRYRQGDYDAAVEDFGKALDLDAKNADALAGRGWSYHAQGQNDMALDDLNAAIDINPNDANNFNERGNVYFDKENYAKAIDDYTEAIQLNPNDPVLYMNRAGAYEKNGDDDKAEEDRKKADELKSGMK